MSLEDYVIQKLLAAEEKAEKNENRALKLFHECNGYMEKLDRIIEILQPKLEFSPYLGSQITLNTISSKYEPNEFMELCDYFGLKEKDEGTDAGTSETPSMNKFTKEIIHESGTE